MDKTETEILQEIIPFDIEGYFDYSDFLEKRFGILIQDNKVVDAKTELTEDTKRKLEVIKRKFKKISEDIKEEIKQGYIEPEASVNDKVVTTDQEEKKKILKGRMGVEAKLRFLENRGIIKREKKGDRKYKVVKYGEDFIPYKYFRIFDLLK